MNNFKPFLLLFIVSILLHSCTTDDTTADPIPATLYDNLFQFHNDIGAAVQTFERDPSEAFTIEGELGTVISYPANAFLNQMDGNIQIELREIFDKKEMVKSNVTCSSDDYALETNTLIYVQAFQNGEQLFTDLTYEVSIPVNNTISQMDGMNLFIDEEGTGGEINWSLEEEVTVNLDTDQNTYTYSTNHDGWMTCADLYETTESETVKVIARPDTETELVYTTSFLVFDEINSVINMEEGVNKFLKNSLPNDLNAKVVILAINNLNKFYLAIEEVSLAEDVDIDPLMKIYTEEEVINLLNQL